MSFLRLGALAALALLVVGCTAPGAQQVPDPTKDAPVDMRSVASLVHVGGDNLSARVADATAYARFVNHNAGEPTLGITKDGSIFYAAITFANDLAGQDLCQSTPAGTAPTCLPRTDILRSDDAGATWKTVTPYAPGGVVRAHATTGDPYVYVDQDTGRVFDIDQQDIACYILSSSDDKGASWVGPTDACFDAPADHQTVVAAKPRTVPATPLYSNLFFLCYNQIADSLCVRSADGGLTFQPTNPPYQSIPSAAPNETDPTNPDLAVCSGLVGHLKAAQDGTVYLPRRNCDQPLVAVTQDDGLTWTVSQVSKRKTYFGGGATIGADPAVAIDAKGVAYYVFQAADGNLYLHYSKDQGKTWSPGVDVLAPGLSVGHLPALIAGDEGRVALAYVGTDVQDGYAASKENMTNATWDGYLAIITNASSEKPTIVTTRVNDHVDPLVRGACGPGRCPGLYDFIDVQVDKDGRPWAAFVDACYKKCATPEGTDKDNSRGGGLGFIATLATGPGLKAGQDALPAVHGVVKTG